MMRTKDWEALLRDGEAAHIRACLREARRFVIDGAAAARWGTVAREVPELVAKHQEFAQPPFDVMWVEVEFAPFILALTGNAPDAECDRRVGYLFDRGNLWTAVQGTQATPDTEVAMTPIVYRLHRPWLPEEQEALAKRVNCSRVFFEGFMWGSGFSQVDDKTTGALRDSHTIEFRAHPRFRDNEHDMWRTLSMAAAGELRSILTLLLLMNRPGLTRIVQDVPARRSFLKGKSVSYFGYSTVEIDLAAKESIIRLGAKGAERGSPRRHEVRGHFVHDAQYKRGRAIGCNHNLVPFEDSKHPDKSWKCTSCLGKRWWRPAFQRGDAGKGFVYQDHVVTASAPGLTRAGSIVSSGQTFLHKDLGDVAAVSGVKPG
jgi:hypothetical protein